MARVSTVQEVFAAMPGQFQAEKAGDLRAVIQFNLDGDGGGQYYATIADKTCAVANGLAPNPTVTMIASAADYLSIINGDLNAMQAFMQGKVKIKGDISVAMRMQSLFTP
jgi:putative sterol carrier protein